MDMIGIDVLVSIEYKGKGVALNFKDNGRIGMILVSNDIPPHERYLFESTIKRDVVFKRLVNDFISNKNSYIISYREFSTFDNCFKNK